MTRMLGFVPPEFFFKPLLLPAGTALVFYLGAIFSLLGAVDERVFLRFKAILFELALTELLDDSSLLIVNGFCY